MTGQIPKYGKSFRLQSVAYEPRADLAPRKYYLKRDPHWYIRSNRNSEKWGIYKDDSQVTYFDTLGYAMSTLLTGIERGFYLTA